MNVAVIITTVGDQKWADLARDHAEPSVELGPEDALYMLHVPTASALVLGAIRNQAAREALASDWLCFLDADDQLDAGYLPAMHAAMHVHNLWRPHDLVVNPTLLIPHVQYVERGRHVGWPGLPPGAGRPIADVNAAVIGTLVPRDLFMAVGGFRSHPIYEDWDLWLRCVREGARAAVVPDAIYLADGTPGRNQGADARSTYDAIRAEHAPHVKGLRWPPS